MIIDKDILTVDRGVICHQVNCKGVMGAGLALAIRSKWPIVYDHYRAAYTSGALVLGYVGIVEVEDGLFVANCAGQKDYGRDKNIVYTDYMSLARCFKVVGDFAKENYLSVFLPYMMGCGLAGGEWKGVYALMKDFISTPIVCRVRRKP